MPPQVRQWDECTLLATFLENFSKSNGKIPPLNFEGYEPYAISAKISVRYVAYSICSQTS
jgi:hypothetical protein